MTIKLVDLLIETIFEDSNTHPVYDEYLTNPQSGRKIKVRSALSSKKHPLYQQALAYIKDKTGSDHGDLGAGTAEDPDVRMATGDMEADYELAKMTGIDTFKDEKNREETENALVASSEAAKKIKKQTDLIEGDKWDQLSPEFQKAALVTYRDTERENKENLQRVVDGYTLEGMEVPEEVQQMYDDTVENVDAIEQQEEQEANEASEAGEEPKSLTDRFREEFLDDETLKGFEELLDDPEAEQQGI